MKADRRHGCIPKPELVYARVNPVVVDDRPGSASCSKEMVGMANMEMNEHKVLSSTLARCPVEINSYSDNICLRNIAK